MTPALFDDQAADVLRVSEWETHYVVLALVRCGPCRRSVMKVWLPCGLVPDDPATVWECPLGPLICGTRRTPSPAAELNLALAQGTIGRFRGIDGLPVATGNPPRKAPRDILQDQWLALLDQVTTAALPAWCDRHGDRLVDVAALRRRVAAALADARAGAEVAPRILQTSPGTW